MDRVLYSGGEAELSISKARNVGLARGGRDEESEESAGGGR